MTTYAAVSNTVLEVGKPIRAIDIRQIRDNAIALGLGNGKSVIGSGTVAASTAVQNTSGAVQFIAGYAVGTSGIIDVQISPDGSTWTTIQRLVGSSSNPGAFGFPLPIAWRWRWVQVSGGANTVTRSGLSA